MDMGLDRNGNFLQASICRRLKTHIAPEHLEEISTIFNPRPEHRHPSHWNSTIRNICAGIVVFTAFSHILCRLQTVPRNWTHSLVSVRSWTWPKSQKYLARLIDCLCWQFPRPCHLQVPNKGGNHPQYRAHGHRWKHATAFEYPLI